MNDLARSCLLTDSSLEHISEQLHLQVTYVGLIDSGSLEENEGVQGLESEEYFSTSRDNSQGIKHI